MLETYDGSFAANEAEHNISMNPILAGIEEMGASVRDVPPGYLVCDGQAVSKKEYSELYEVIQDLYRPKEVVQVAEFLADPNKVDGYP